MRKVRLHALSERARAFAVDDEDLAEAGDLRIVDEFAEHALRLVDHQAADVDLAARRRRLAEEVRRAASALTIHACAAVAG